MSAPHWRCCILCATVSSGDDDAECAPYPHNGNIIIVLLRFPIDHRIYRNNYKIQFRFGRKVQTRLRFDKILLYAINVYAYITTHPKFKNAHNYYGTRQKITFQGVPSGRMGGVVRVPDVRPISSAAGHHDKLACILDQSTFTRVYDTRITVVEIFPEN